MYNYNYGYDQGYGYGCNKCLIPNRYCHPRPQHKKMEFLSTVKVEKFTVNQVAESHIKECCDDICVGVSVKNPVLILSGVTDCISPDIYYTFDLDRSVPIDFNALQVFIKAEKCGFFRGAVELEETEITIPYRLEPNFKFTSENLKKFYRAKLISGCCPHDGEVMDGDGFGYRDRNEFQDNILKTAEFLEVDLDLRGNVAVSGDFLRNEFGPSPEFGRKHRYVLYMNNAGRLVLTRDCKTTRKYGDFDL